MEENGDRTTTEELDIRPAEEMEENGDRTTTEELDIRPFKKIKYPESSALDASLLSTTISKASMVSESSESTDSESSVLLSMPTFPTMSTLSSFSEVMNEEHDKRTVPTDDDKETICIVSELMNEKTISTDDDMKPEAKHTKNDLTYDFLPQDYTLTYQDECAQCVILYSSEDEVLVQIDDISVQQRSLACLLDKGKWLDDQVISAYICCMKEQLSVQNKNNAKVYFENPLVTRLLKRDGEIGIDGPTGMTNVVKNYLNHDMILLPINIKDSHWYLACLNVEKNDTQVIDSLCWESNRADLALTLQGIQYHLDIIKSQENLSNQNWQNFDEWTITEQLQVPIQEDSSSCGLFMLKFMEYWTGHALSYQITQEIITSFRMKLASILLCWKTNTAPPTVHFDKIDDTQVDPNDFIMSDSPIEPEECNSLSVESKYQSLLSVLSNLSLHELVGGLCNYIKTISSAEALKQIWVQSSQPYLISLTLKNLQEMLMDELPMNHDCFNLIVRKIMFDDIQTVKRKRGSISKHYLDMQFWRITDFGRHPNFRKKIDMDQLENSVRSWPDSYTNTNPS